LAQRVPEVKGLDRKDSKMLTIPPKTITQTNCITCNLKLTVPPNTTLLTCPSCKIVQNPYDQDLRFMKCISCHTVLQFSLSLARMSNTTQPIITCGQCKIPNDIPRSILFPQPKPESSILITVGRNGDVVLSLPREQKINSAAIISTLPVNK